MYRVVASRTKDRGEVVFMNTYEVVSLLFLGGSFLIALLTYVDRNNKRKFMLCKNLKNSYLPNGVA